MVKVIAVMLHIEPGLLFSLSRHFYFYINFPFICPYLNPTILNDMGQNFLYNMNNFKQLIIVLESPFDFNVNHCDNDGHTIVTKYLIIFLLQN